jgi:hypothetical protein
MRILYNIKRSLYIRYRGLVGDIGLDMLVLALIIMWPYSLGPSFYII